MYRLLLIAIFVIPTVNAFAAGDSCSVSGTAYDVAGKPLQSVVRLVDRHTSTSRFIATNAQAAFGFDDLVPDESGHRYQIDILSPPTVVTGSRIPVRSIIGIAPRFACSAGQTARLDVRAQVR